MIALFITGLISLVACLVSMFAAIEQGLRGNDSACATSLLWMMYTFTSFSICLLLHITINN